MNCTFLKIATNSSVFFFIIFLGAASAAKEASQKHTVDNEFKKAIGSGKDPNSTAAKVEPKQAKPEQTSQTKVKYEPDGMEDVRKIIGLSDSHRYQDSLQTLLKEPGNVETFQHVVLVLTDIPIRTLKYYMKTWSLKLGNDPCTNFTGTHCKEFKKIILDVFNNIGERDNKLPTKRVCLQILAWLLRIYEVDPSEENNKTDLITWQRSISGYTDDYMMEYTVVHPEKDETFALHEQLIEKLGGYEEQSVKSALFTVKDEMARYPEEIQKITPDIVLDIVKAFSLKQDTIDGAQHTRVSIDWNQLKQAAGDFFYNKMRVGLENSRVFEKFWENEGDFVTIEIKSIASRAYYFLWEMYWTVFYKITEEFYVNCRIGTLEEALEKRKKEYNKGMAKLAKLTLDCYKRSLGRRTPNPAIKIPLV